LKHTSIAKPARRLRDQSVSELKAMVREAKKAAILLKRYFKEWKKS
jgi:hypothetical protein